MYGHETYVRSGDVCMVRRHMYGQETSVRSGDVCTVRRRLYGQETYLRSVRSGQNKSVFIIEITMHLYAQEPPNSSCKMNNPRLTLYSQS